MITYRDVENRVMPPEKRAEAKQDLFAYYVGRKITYVLTIPFLYTNISPNTVTWLSIILLIAGFILSFFAKSLPFMIVTWFLFFMWSMFDGVDGNIARYKKQYSALGDILDTMGGYMAISLMYFSIGIIAAHNGGILSNLVVFPSECMIILGALSSICGIFPRLVLHKVNSSYGNDSTESLRDKSSYSLIKIIALNLSSVPGGTMVFSFISIFVNALDIFTVVYFLLNSIKMVASLYIILKKLAKRGNKQ